MTPHVGDRRKPIPLKIKLEVLCRQARCTSCGERLGNLANVQFDHRPALVTRGFDEAANDFIPPQLDPDFIEGLHKDCHLTRTTGRKAGALRTITTRGSDIGEAARTKTISASQAEFRARILRKEPGRSARPPSRWAKRPFNSKKRKAA